MTEENAESLCEKLELTNTFINDEIELDKRIQINQLPWANIL